VGETRCIAGFTREAETSRKICYMLKAAILIGSYGEGTPWRFKGLARVKA
jgi:hypothetical protein